jgi:hypothetical protein
LPGIVHAFSSLYSYIYFKILISLRHYSPLVLASLMLCITTDTRAQSESNFVGFFADISVGYRDVNATTNSSLSLNGTSIPSTLSSGQPSNTIGVLTAGYNLALLPGFVLGIGANISPGSGQAQQSQIKALNQTITLPGNKPLYNYGFFLAPGVVLGDGLAYFKTGIQTQVNNNNINPNFNGYLLGLGYKQFVYRSIYLFGEADYVSYQAQTTTKTVVSSGRVIYASVTTKPQSSRYLIGLGYQF